MVMRDARSLRRSSGTMSTAAAATSGNTSKSPPKSVTTESFVSSAVLANDEILRYRHQPMANRTVANRTVAPNAHRHLPLYWAVQAAHIEARLRLGSMDVKPSGAFPSSRRHQQHRSFSTTNLRADAQREIDEALSLSQTGSSYSSNNDVAIMCAPQQPQQQKPRSPRRRSRHSLPTKAAKPNITSTSNNVIKRVRFSDAVTYDKATESIMDPSEMQERWYSPRDLVESQQERMAQISVQHNLPTNSIHHEPSPLIVASLALEPELYLKQRQHCRSIQQIFVKGILQRQADAGLYQQHDHDVKGLYQQSRACSKRSRHRAILRGYVDEMVARKLHGLE